VTVGGKKMSKSLGNFVTLKDAFGKFNPLVVRFFILQSHYRSTLDFSDEALRGAKAGWEKLMDTVRNLRGAIASTGTETGGQSPAVDCAEYKSRFLETMNDDFNTPQAIGVLFDLTREINQVLHGERKPGAGSLRPVNELYAELGGTILGIIPESLPTASLDGNLESGLVELLIELRNEVRKQKLWSLSDLIRDRLKSSGIVLEDKKEGTTWKKAGN